MRKQSLKGSTVSREHSLEVEAKKFIKEDRVDQKPRRTRFSGSYNVELQIKKQESQVSVEQPPKKRGRPSKQMSDTSISSVSTNQSRVQPLKLKMNGNALEVVHQQQGKQDSSSSSESGDSEDNQVKTLPQPAPTSPKIRRPRKLSSSSSEDESVEINNNVKPATEVAEKLVIPPVAAVTTVKVCNFSFQAIFGVNQTVSKEVYHSSSDDKLTIDSNTDQQIKNK